MGQLLRRQGRSQRELYLPVATPPPPPVDTRAEDTLPSVVLRDADTRRAQRGYAGAAIICLVGALGLQLAEGPAVLRWLSTAGVAAAGIGSGWLAWRRRDGSEFTDREAAVSGVLMCLAALSALAFIGPAASPAVVLVLIVTALAMSHEARGRRVFAVIALGYGVLVAASMTGLIAPITPALEDPLAQVVGAAVVEVVLAVSYWFGRSARRSTVAALERAQRARLELAQRDALLHEARADLHRLLRGGRVGRFSGHRFAGYELEDVIGRGGMAEVYRAKDAEGAEVALKVLSPNLAGDAVLVSRFFREAEISSNLRSPHIVTVLGSGEAPDGSPFLAMELLHGSSLADRLRAEGALELDEVAKLVGEVAVGLSAAHAAGIVHRDIKPGNLFRWDGGAEPIWKVLDFGVSKLLAGTSTLTGDALIGTPGYMPPEQAFGREVDARADVFALGAVAYRALTGRPPFDGPDVVSVLLCAAQRQPSRPTMLGTMPEDVELVLALALAKKREDRWASVEELADAFRRACDGSLSNALRIRALELLSRAPWDSEIAPVSAREAPTRHAS